MSFSIPNKGDGLADAQSLLFRQHIDVLVAGVEGTGITSGCAVAPSSGMVISVAAGGVVRAGVAAATAAATPTVGAADATLPRFDIVVIADGNSAAIRAGTAAANPQPPTLTAGDVALAMVYVPPAATAMAAGNIVDMRVDVPSIQGGVALSGDATIYVSQSKSYTITNYNVFSSYVVQVSA
uniref:hypothetical protein n=1 Tax=Acidiphilium sp. TaxID=527 RepID=UPI00258C328C